MTSGDAVAIEDDVILGAAPDPHSVLREGDAFKAFMVGYMALRVVVDFLKPYPAVFLGLGVLQWAAVLTIAYYVPDIRRWASASGRSPARGTEALQ